MAYTVANYKTFVRNRLQNISIDDALLLQFANDANREIINIRVPGMDWEFMQSNFIGTLTIGSLKYDYETNWAKPLDMTLTDPDANAVYPTYIPYAQYRQRYPDPTAGAAAVPSVWTTFGRKFILGPTKPDQIYTLDMAFLKLPTTLASDGDTIDIPDQWAEVQVLGMFARCLEARRRYDQAQVIRQDLDVGVEGSLINKMIEALMVPTAELPTHMLSGFESA